MKNCSYTKLLAVSLIIVVAAKATISLLPEKPEPGEASPVAMTTSTAIKEKTQEKSEEKIEKATQDSIAEESSATQEKAPIQKEIGTEYFKNSLFIGDSRTVGLSEYGDLGAADVFADSGMSIYKIWNISLPMQSGERSSLEELLTEKQYDKIYIMLGINELGYSYEQTVSRYQELVAKLQELQPSAILFLEANLHVAKEKSVSSDIFNNQNIDRFNQAIEQFADNSTIFYIDVNEIFDDGEGNLSSEYTSDNTHILGKYYTDWAAWILTKAVE